MIRVALSTLRNLLGVGSASNDMVVYLLLDALTAVGVPDTVQSAAFWPLIAGSVILTELASAVGAAAVKVVAPASGALTVAIAAAPLTRSAPHSSRSSSPLGYNGTWRWCCWKRCGSTSRPAPAAGQRIGHDIHSI